jgi:hypothetical protein
MDNKPDPVCCFREFFEALFLWELERVAWQPPCGVNCP